MKKKGLVVRPMIFSELNSRCQVDLIDYRTSPSDGYKFLMVYQDHLTKFVILRPLKTKTADEVAYHILDPFTILGAPVILQSDNGREFVNQIIDSLKIMWPELKLVNGKPRHSQSQGSVERANQDIENILTTWVVDNNTDKWHEGLRFAQLMKNQSYHSGVKQTPYEALFGTPAKVGLLNTHPPLLSHMLQKISMKLTPPTPIFLQSAIFCTIYEDIDPIFCTLFYLISSFYGI